MPLLPTRRPVGSALDEDTPIAFFAGVQAPWIGLVPFLRNVALVGEPTLRFHFNDLNEC